MTVEDRLRRSLEHKASEARPSDAAWNQIAERLADGDRGLRRWMVPALALGTAAALVTVTLAVMGQGEDSSDVKAAAPASTTTLVRQSLEEVVPISAVFPGIWPENTWDEYIPTIQAQEDWRFDPVQVATTYLNERGFELPNVAEYEEFSEDPTCGHVRYTLMGGDEAEGHFVEVCRATLPDGKPFVARGPEGKHFDVRTDELPFVVTGAWTDRFRYRLPLYESPMEFSIGIDVPGRLDVRAGAFNSEWIDELTIDVTAEEIEGPGYKVPARLDLGPEAALPKSLLVQIFHRPADGGVMALTEFRLDLADDSPAARFPRACPAPSGSGSVFLVGVDLEQRTLSFAQTQGDRREQTVPVSPDVTICVAVPEPASELDASVGAFSFFEVPFEGLVDHLVNANPAPEEAVSSSTWTVIVEDGVITRINEHVPQS